MEINVVLGRVGFIETSMSGRLALFRGYKKNHILFKEWVMKQMYTKYRQQRRQIHQRETEIKLETIQSWERML